MKIPTSLWVTTSCPVVSPRLASCPERALLWAMAAPVASPRAQPPPMGRSSAGSSSIPSSSFQSSMPSLSDPPLSVRGFSLIAFFFAKSVLYLDCPLTSCAKCVRSTGASTRKSCNPGIVTFFVKDIISHRRKNIALSSLSHD